MVRTRSQTTWDTSHNSLVSTNNSCNPRSGLSEGHTSKPNDYIRKLRKRIRFSDHDDNSQLSSSHLDPTDEGKNTNRKEISIIRKHHSIQKFGQNYHMKFL